MNYPGKFPLIPGTVSMDNPLQKSNIIPVVSFLIKNWNDTQLASERCDVKLEEKKVTKYVKEIHFKTWDFPI